MSYGHLWDYFIQIIIAEIHERALRNTTTIPFPYLIFRLCRESIVLMITEVDDLMNVTWTQDIGMIKKDTNPVSQRWDPQPEVRLPEMFEGPTADQGCDRYAPDDERTTIGSSGADTATAPPTTSAPTRTLCPCSGCLFTILAEYIQSLVQRQTHTDTSWPKLVH